MKQFYRTEQNRTEQNRTEQNRTERNRIGVLDKFFQLNKNTRTGILIYLVLFVGLIFLVGKSIAAGTYTAPIPSVTISSDDYDDPGSWTIDKSAKWTSKSIAQVKFEVDTIMKTQNTNYVDIILVIDISGSMGGDKLDRAKEDATNLVESILSESKNRVALISFDSKSTIVSNFTNDKDILINYINNLSAKKNTNYNAGLINVQTILEDYAKEKNRDLMMLFLTDGFPNEDKPNQIATYHALKEAYPYMIVSGIQYEMGDTVIDAIKEISDYQYIASMDTLNNVLFEASVVPVTYDNFQIVDYIDDEYFECNSVDDIEVSQGTITFDKDTQKITWTIDYLVTGHSAEMTINLNLKSEYLSQLEDENVYYYPTNEKEEIITKLPDEDEKTKESELTPVLASKYTVYYNTNCPSDESEEYFSSEKYAPFTNVAMETDEPTCDGYVFKGWDIVTDVTMINDETFRMPESDVKINGTWTKLSTEKSMNGKVYEKQTLYKKAVELGKQYTGKVTDEVGNTIESASKVYTYNGDGTNNNVIFANTCWKILRTTETGGTKLLYNGAIDSDGGCNNSGTAQQIQTSKFNSNSSSLSYAGYMYGNVYATSYKNISYTSVTSILLSNSLYTTYYYADSYDYGTTTSSKYTLTNPYLFEPTDDNSNLVGKYTNFSSSTDSSSDLYYIVATNGIKIYYVNIKYGNSESKYNKTYYFYDGNDTSNTPTIITTFDWPTSFDKISSGMYTCGETYACTNPSYVISVSATSYKYFNNDYKYIYGNDIEYDNGIYTLKDTFEASDSPSYETINNFNDKHYTCFNDTGECTSVYYVYYYSSSTSGSSSIYYITLKSGKTIDDALYEMIGYQSQNYITDSSYNLNAKDSTIKGVIDSWYLSNIYGTTYENLIDNTTIYCNDRAISNLNGWNKNGENISDYIYFYGSGTVSYECKNLKDQFSIENEEAKLTYPIGLATAPETYNNYKNNSSSMKTGSNWWLLSPNSFYGNTIFMMDVNSYGSATTYHSLSFENGVRPVITLISDAEYSSGDGTTSNPYVVEVT